MDSASPAGCGSDSECADTIDCTADTCVIASGSCRHSPTPALCAAGESCNPMTGCEAGMPCATNADCADDDPCTTMELCDPAARVCTYRPLDGDGDEDPPRVCGGADCDDSRPDIYSGAAERCNAQDDDCDGTIDEAANGSCMAGQVCMTGACVCAPGTMSCGGACVDVSTDANHCGGCGRLCDGSCTGGTCACSSGRTWCGDRCVDTSTDARHCGSCTGLCAAGQECTGGSCSCGAGEISCSSACTDPLTDGSNCGECGVNCGGLSTSGSCVAGVCQFPSCPTMMVCAGRMACTFFDPLNCGSCGNRCPSGSACVRGGCL
jgi:hypothetical protein